MSYDNIIENDYTINFHSGSLNEYTVNPVQSLGSLTVSTSPSSISTLKNKTFTLINTRGVSKTYVFKNDPSLATGGLEGSEIIVNLDSLTNEGQVASEIKTAIESVNGHNGTIVPTISSGTPKVVNLKQLIGGTDGNKSIALGGTMGTLMSKSNFTGGTNGSKPEHLPLRFSLRTVQNIRGQNE